MSATPVSGCEPKAPTRIEDAACSTLVEEVAQLREALQSSRQIGTAVGLLAQRFGCSTEQAQRLLLRVSQDSNTKVRTVARVLVSGYDGQCAVDDEPLLREVVTHLPRAEWSSGVLDQAHEDR